MRPPDPSDPIPTAMLAEPPAPLVLSPVLNATAPLLPTLESPVLIVKLPLTPSEPPLPELDVRRVNAPLDPSADP